MNASDGTGRRMIGLNTYDRHVIRRFATSYLVLVGVLIVFFIVLHYVEFVDDFHDRGAPEREVFTVYYANSIPDIVHLVSPLALFMACVLLASSLAQKLEFIALQTSGVSLRRLRRPFLLVAAVVAAAMFWFNGWVVPQTNRVKIAFEQQYTKEAQTATETSNILRQTRPGGVLSVGVFERSTNTAHTLTLSSYSPESRLLERIDAPRMIWIDSTQTWRILSPVIRRFDADGLERRSQPTYFDTLLVLLPRDIARTDGDVEGMTITEAGDYLDTLRRSGADNINPPLVVYFSKFAYPLANFILVLLGVPMAGVRRRGGQALTIAAGIFTAFAYLSLGKILEALGFQGVVPPIVAAWLPHVIFLVVAVLIMRRANT